MSSQIEVPKKVDPRRAKALENLAKGRQKLEAMKQLGLVKTGRKPKKDIRIKESDSESDTESEEDDESDSDSDDEYLLKRKKAKKIKGKGKVRREKAPKMNKLKNELKEMKSLIYQLNQAKLTDNQKPNEKVIINMAPPSAVQPPKPPSDDLKRAMFGNIF